jgi:solute carrier family 10 (sodium/bile acid cotransporter), member 7
MTQFLAKRWFLLSLLGGLGLAALWPAALRPWTALLPSRVVVAVALFLMAWSLESRSLGRSLVRPWPALWAAAISYGAVPLLALGAGWLLPGPDDLRVGLLLMASVPCTLASAVVWTRRAGGNEATALLVILLTTCVGWLATPAWLRLLGSAMPAGADTPGMMGELLLVLVLPVGLGQLGRAVPPLARLATRLKGALGVVAQLLVLSVVVKGAVQVCDSLEQEASGLAFLPLVAAAAACLATHLAALFGGLASGRLLGFDRPNRIAVAFAGSQKTLPVALVLFESYFQSAYRLALVPIVFYHVGQLVADTLIADRLSLHPSGVPDLDLASGRRQPPAGAKESGG